MAELQLAVGFELIFNIKVINQTSKKLKIKITYAEVKMYINYK